MTITMLLTVLHLKYVVAARQPIAAYNTICMFQLISAASAECIEAQKLYVGPIPTKKKR
jgi:hypothetical protein